MAESLCKLKEFQHQLVYTNCHIKTCLFSYIRDEFVQKYLETRQRLMDKLNDTYKKIAEHNR
jgi:hypothetical protein